MSNVIIPRFLNTQRNEEVKKKKKTKTFLFAQTYLSQCSGCNPYESFLILAVILSNATSTRRPSLLITCMFSIMLCFGHQSYEELLLFLDDDDDTFVREKKDWKKEEERRFFDFFFFFSSSSSFSRRQKHDVCLSD